MDIPVSEKANRFPRTRWEIIPRLMQESNIDVLVATSPENVAYTAGHYQCTLPIVRDRISATIIPASGQATYLVVDVMEGAARRNSWMSHIAVYKENAESPLRALAALLHESGFGRGRIAIEEEALTQGAFRELEEHMPDASFHPGSAILSRARSIKTPEEIDFISSAVRATETAHRKVYEVIKPGDTEVGIARRLKAQNLLEGADYVDSSLVATGRNNLEGHHIADETPIARGDIVNIDSGGRFCGYCSDMSRPVVVGPPSNRQRDKWRKLHQVQRRGIEALIVGVPAGEAFAHLRQNRSYSDVWFYGHGLGLFVHDPPMMLPFYKDGLKTTTNLSTRWVLEPNMLIMVEFGLTDPDDGQAYYFEDLVLTTDKGPQLLSTVIDTTELYMIR